MALASRTSSTFRPPNRPYCYPRRAAHAAMTAVALAAAAAAVAAAAAALAVAAAAAALALAVAAAGWAGTGA